MIRWWEHGEKGVTDGQMNRQTDWTSHIAAWSQLKTIGHLLSTMSSFVHHFKAIGKFKLESQSRNAQFESKFVIFFPLWPQNLRDDLDLLHGHHLSLALGNNKRSYLVMAVINTSWWIAIPYHFTESAHQLRWKMWSLGHVCWMTSAKCLATDRHTGWRPSIASSINLHWNKFPFPTQQWWQGEGFF